MKTIKVAIILAGIYSVGSFLTNYFENPRYTSGFFAGILATVLVLESMEHEKSNNK